MVMHSCLRISHNVYPRRWKNSSPETLFDRNYEKIELIKFGALY